MTSIAVVILNFNGEKLLPQFLPSVVAHSGSAEVIVIDNGSTDGSVRLLRERFPSVKTILLEQNFGFCGGYNRGLKQVSTPNYILLNSDIEVTAGWIDPIQKLFESNPVVAAIQPKILSYTNKDRFEYAGAGGGYIDSLGYPFCRGRIFESVEKDHSQYNDSRPVFWASGACLAIRAATYERLGGLDEDFFAHMEEIDLCWKINRTQQQVWYCGQSVVYHLGAGTLGYESPRKTYLNFRNGLTLLLKHLNSVEFFYKFPLRIGLDWVAAFFFLLKGKRSNAGAVFKAHVHFLAGWKKNFAKRKALRAVFPSYNRQNIYTGSIVIDYFLRGKRHIDV